MIEQDSHEIEVEIADAKKAIELSEALQRLEANPDYKKVFIEHYMGEFALTNVKMRGGLGFRMNDKYMEANLRKLDSIGEFFEFCRNLHAHGAQMKTLLEEAETLRDEEDTDTHLEM